VQKIASVAYVVVFAAMAVLSSLDHRFGWSQVPPTVVVVGQVLVALGLGIAVLVVLQNNYASANVAVRSNQAVVSSGLYGLVRHPMYLGVLVTLIGAPLALDSYWGLVLLVPLLAVLVSRIVDEEKLLRAELAGYDYYAFRVRRRLVPYVW
jgi:protein-S-isoprenylcysteine O-methyltransferase Ste14